MMDYSQHGEEQVILARFLRDGGYAKGGGEIVPGRFLDIGAYHPTQFSNTRALYELGWSGVMVEPSPGCMRALLAEYGKEPRIELIQAAASIEPGLVSLHISDDAVSTSDEGSYQTWKEAGGFLGTVFVPGLPLSEIFNRFGGFDFVNIDAEGVSADLFLHMLKLGVYPPCVCVEHDGRTTELLTASSALGYSGKVIGANLIVWQ
jgi:FkbM family methyltransferase